MTDTAVPKISALVLSWNELDVVRKSVNRLKKEPIEVWVVDNGSTDGTQEWLKKQKGINVIQLPKNMGACVARNRVIERFSGDYLLMLDSDILYIPKSAFGLYEILVKLPKNAYCLGIHNERWDGTQDISEADKEWVGAGRVLNNFAIAWTQYGLFKGDLIRKYKFPEYGIWGKAGYGYEDDYLNALMEKHGYVSYHCTKPLYYHKAHTTKRSGIKTHEAERREELYKRFPDYVHWTIRRRIQT